jgi:hypothetical protein
VLVLFLDWADSEYSFVGYADYTSHSISKYCASIQGVYARQHNRFSKQQLMNCVVQVFLKSIFAGSQAELEAIMSGASVQLNDKSVVGGFVSAVSYLCLSVCLFVLFVLCIFLTRFNVCK